MEKTTVPLQILKPKDLQRLFSLSARTALRRYHAFRDSLGKSAHQSLYLHEVINLEGLPVEKLVFSPKWPFVAIHATPSATA